MTDPQGGDVMHADAMSAVTMLVGRTIDRADAELLSDLDGGLRRARDIISRLMSDPVARRCLLRTEHWDGLELFGEDESAQTELCWMWERD